MKCFVNFLNFSRFLGKIMVNIAMIYDCPDNKYYLISDYFDFIF